MHVYFWGRWRGAERLLWHPRGGYVRPEDALPAEVFKLVQAAKAWTVWTRGLEAWTVLPVSGGAFLASMRLSEPVMRAAARQAFKLLPGADALLGMQEGSGGK